MQIREVVVASVQIDSRMSRIGTERRAAHHVRGEQRCCKRTQRERFDGLARVACGCECATAVVDRRDASRAGGKLDLGHRGHRAARAVPQVIVQWIIEYGRVVVCEANRAAFALPMEAVAEQRNQYVEMPKLAHVL